MKISDSIQPIGFALAPFAPIISIANVFFGSLEINKKIKNIQMLNSNMVDPSNLLKLEKTLGSFRATILLGALFQMSLAYFLTPAKNDDIDEEGDSSILATICAASSIITLFFFYIIDPRRTAVAAGFDV
ncbi:MAG: hypothetical protein L0207_07100 [Chlamydiae bacterium]|nr:hypothetical protein [Chlamydiota bacterium]